MHKESKKISIDKAVAQEITDLTVEALKSPKIWTYAKKVLSAILTGNRNTIPAKQKRMKTYIPGLGPVILDVKINIVQSNSRQPFPIAGVVPKGKEFIFMLNINSNRVKYILDNPEKYRKMIYAIVTHELTHVFDRTIWSGEEEPSGKVLQEKGFYAYANMPSEVRARNRELIEYLRRDWKKIKLMAETQYRDKGSRKYFYALLSVIPGEYSEWYAVYTPKNKKLQWDILDKEIKRLLGNPKVAYANSNPVKLQFAALDAISEYLSTANNLMSILELEHEQVDYFIRHGLKKVSSSGYDARKFQRILWQHYYNKYVKDLDQIKAKLISIQISVDDVDEKFFLKKATAFNNFKHMLSGPIKFFQANTFRNDLVKVFTNTSGGIDRVNTRHLRPNAERIEMFAKSTNEMWLNKVSKEIQEINLLFTDLRKQALLIKQKLSVVGRI